MLTSPKPLFKIKLMYQGGGSTCKHKLSASMLAGVIYRVYASLEG